MKFLAIFAVVLLCVGAAKVPQTSNAVDEELVTTVTVKLPTNTNGDIEQPAQVVEVTSDVAATTPLMLRIDEITTWPTTLQDEIATTINTIDAGAEPVAIDAKLADAVVPGIVAIDTDALTSTTPATGDIVKVPLTQTSTVVAVRRRRAMDNTTPTSVLTPPVIVTNTQVPENVVAGADGGSTTPQVDDNVKMVTPTVMPVGVTVASNVIMPAVPLDQHVPHIPHIDSDVPQVPQVIVDPVRVHHDDTIAPIITTVAPNVVTPQLRQRRAVPITIQDAMHTSKATPVPPMPTTDMRRMTKMADMTKLRMMRAAVDTTNVVTTAPEVVTKTAEVVTDAPVVITKSAEVVTNMPVTADTAKNIDIVTDAPAMVNVVVPEMVTELTNIVGPTVTEVVNAIAVPVDNTNAIPPNCDTECTKLDLNPICAFNGECYHEFANQCIMNIFVCTHPSLGFKTAPKERCLMHWLKRCTEQDLKD